MVRVEPEEGAVGVIHGGVKRLSEYPVVDGNYLVRGCVGWGRCGCGDGGGGPCGASECAAPREAAPEGCVGHVDSCMYLRESVNVCDVSEYDLSSVVDKCACAL